MGAAAGAVPASGEVRLWSKSLRKEAIMPYRRVGKTVQHKKGGKWTKKQTATSVANAEAAMRLLRGLESGSIKKSDVGRPKRTRQKPARKPTRRRTTSRSRKRR